MCFNRYDLPTKIIMDIGIFITFVRIKGDAKEAIFIVRIKNSELDLKKFSISKTRLIFRTCMVQGYDKYASLVLRMDKREGEIIP